MEPTSTEHKDKLYLVIRKDLSSGAQGAQLSHVVAEFVIKNPNVASRWNSLSNSLIVLEVKDAETLSILQEDATIKGLNVTAFREPDFGDGITALAFAPGDATRKFLSNLPCAGKNINEAEQATLRAREARAKELSYAMEGTDQTEGQNVLQHGQSVREHYFALLAHLKGEINLNEATNWRIPAWVDQYKSELLTKLPSRFIMDRYLTLHDCGKPAARVYDENGKIHFPNHAAVSERVYREAYGDGSASSEAIAHLIADDMVIHTVSALELPAFVKCDYAVAHLLAGLSELVSNSALFGGLESIGFKSKYKRLDQRGKAIVKLLFEVDMEKK